ncbi:PepSY domain-containing protein [Alkalitalea saponilacus]|uniref:PepSY-associated TM region n=1 Tax=Alkalitalea saponilacus TaxID=889453 RepID=A0A1T5G4U4_9BACT|nr:PepSY domain-containing protein [Alkalitalea saponilacus]ASB47854.1 hypothetical protein CDL62_01160 [Alkalitalea saponilacus]SKC03483.1 PepSY-associated TM region [Alkalitalea saponilacus]
MEPTKSKTTKSRWLKTMRKYHKWPGIVITIFILFFATSGIILNHRDWFSSVDINRSYLPPDYRLTNWNLASIKGAVHLTTSDMVVYGNIGAWLTNNKMEYFIDLNDGFPKGIDSRKVEAMLYTDDGILLAGTLFGLYLFNGEFWDKIEIPTSEKRITDLIERQNQIHILTRSHLLITDDLKSFEIITLPEYADDDNKVSLFRTLWTLHSGEMFGEWGKIVVDILGLGLIFLGVSGILHWLFPKWVKRRKRKNGSIQSLKSGMKTNLKWHNKIGYILAFFLIFTTITGMFLRPPLLIPIAQSRVAKIPFSKLDNPNPWYDKLRRIAWDDLNNKYLVSTSEGFFHFDANFSESANYIHPQPPVSIMGCTVLEPYTAIPGVWLVGSFSGLFQWDMQSNTIQNVITRRPVMSTARMGPPISSNLISGYIRTNRAEYLVEYSRGMEVLSGHAVSVPSMPAGIKDATPFSLWNLALEVHTGRIFNHLIGSWYILYIPLAGITLLIVIISGFVIWWLAHRKKRK